MNRTSRKFIATSALLPLVAHAALVQAPDAGSPQLGFDGHAGQYTPGPLTLTASDGSQVVYTSAGGSGGFTSDRYGLVANGNWWAAGNFTFAFENGDLDGGRTSSMTFTFAHPVSSVGGFMNYVPSIPGDTYYGDSDFVLMALGRDGSVLEQYALADIAPIVTPNGFNGGDYRGISRSAGDIYGFEIQGAGVVKYLDFTPAAVVPESSGIAMLLAGLGLLGVTQRRRRRD